MKSTVEKCTIVVRRLKPGAGVAETGTDVESLEQLFEHCLGLAEQHLLERLVVSGRDGRGRKRALSFTFQSVSGRD
ncbi:MAG: hypothetical protein H7Z38_12940 [Rubrivivax sp.]|nr:hypothetical protein [Pyrinomonadaceae bacterium]